MKEQVRECAEYFRDRPGYHRILSALRQKYERFGRAAGTVQLPDASDAECEAARLLFGRPFSAPMRFRTSQFEAALQQTRFQGVCLKEVLEAYFGAEIKTSREVQETQDRRIASILNQAANTARGERSAQWIHALEERRGSGYSLLRREAAKDPESTRTDLLRACKSMDWLELTSKEPIRLAVLSAAATSDPHALDSGTRCGKLFQHLLSFRSGLPNPGANAEQRDHLYYQNGILCDSISSLVTQIGLVLSTETGEHPAYRLFRQRHEICTLSLASLSHVRGAGSPSGRVYIVENEMVFSQLCDQAAQFHSPLICTSGQPSVAAVRLLDLLAANGTLLFYSGDFDGKGLSIVGQLCARYPHLLKLWHMAPEDYERCRSDEVLSDASLSLLRGCDAAALEPTARAVRQGGCAGYQELLIPQLEADLIATP